LDSPAVALAWTCAAGRAVGEELSGRVAWGFFLFVWSIYLADRLIDAARCPDWSLVPERLRFGQRHRGWFLVALCGSLVATLVLALGVSGEIFRRVLMVAPGVPLYFALFVKPLSGRKLPGKEFVIGFFCTLPIWVAFGWHREFALTLPIYAGLVACNCLLIASRERDLDRRLDPGAATAWWRTLDRDLNGMGLGLAAAGAVGLALGFSGHRERYAAFLGAEILAALALVCLHRQAGRLSAGRVRLLADLCLLGPAVCAAV
jgi:hypothetical protein